jgi:uncharacterized membrane protein
LPAAALLLFISTRQAHQPRHRKALIRRRRLYYELQGFNTGDAVPYVLVVAANLVLLLSLAAQLAFLFGLKAKTQVRATVGVLGLFFIWCMIPLVIRVFTGTKPWILYFSPFAGIAVNQVPELGLSVSSGKVRGPITLVG